MNDEIKEILLKFNKEVEKAKSTRNPYSSEDKKFKCILVSLSEEHFNVFKNILDYITNLQQENERLKEYYDIMVQFNQKNLDRFCDYKSRCEKAIEYIKKHPTKTWYYLKKNHNKKINPNTDLILCQVDLLNILQNGSDTSE